MNSSLWSEPLSTKFKKYSNVKYIVFALKKGKSNLYYFDPILTHLCRPVRSTFAVRETAFLGMMGEPRVPP